MIGDWTYILVIAVIAIVVGIFIFYGFRHNVEKSKIINDHDFRMTQFRGNSNTATAKVPSKETSVDDLTKAGVTINIEENNSK